MNKKVLVAMSGGVDSSVAAALLAKDGFDVVGVTLRLLPRAGTGFGCCGSPEDILIAKRSAEAAGIPHYVLDYSNDFEANVINYFVDSYIQGETPNPCLACNRHIKFDKLKQFADSLNIKLLATGHYARIISSSTNGISSFRLFESVDSTKDQSYVLYNLTKEALATTLFPVGNKPKSEIRALALKLKLPNADKKDSQEICFVPGRDYTAFLKDRIEQHGLNAATTKPGPILDSSGAVIGEHRGTAYYTIGQRNGLNLSLNKRVYVTRIDAHSNTLIVGDDQQSLNNGLNAIDVHWVHGPPASNTFDAQIKIRYKHEPCGATISITNSGFTAQFHEPQKAVSPGQAAVIYRWDDHLQAREVLGGGKISRAL